MQEPNRIPLTDFPRNKEPQKIPLTTTSNYHAEVHDDLWINNENNQQNNQTSVSELESNQTN